MQDLSTFGNIGNYHLILRAYLNFITVAFTSLSNSFAFITNTSSKYQDKYTCKASILKFMNMSDFMNPLNHINIEVARLIYHIEET